jgi:riboflavin-specific deaminase-like protein
MRRLFPPTDDRSHALDLARDVLSDAPAVDELGTAELAHLYAYPHDRRWVRVNMVGSLDGTATVDGVAEGLSSDADRRVFRLLRALSDVILVGAGTVRAEGYREPRVAEQHAGLRAANGQDPVPPVAVVSRSLDLDPGTELFAQERTRTVVLTCEQAPADRRARLAEVADVVDCGATAVDLGSALDALAERGLRRVLCEGGPSLLHELVAGGHLDELCLTIAPVLAGGGERHVLHGGPFPVPAPLVLASLLEEDGVLLGRWVRPDHAGR